MCNPSNNSDDCSSTQLHSTFLGNVQPTLYSPCQRRWDIIWVMQKITWKYPCTICQRPIQRGKPTILFATDRPEMIGICHSTCGYRWFRYGHFQMCPPGYLSDEQISFLVQFFHRLYSLPGGQEPNGELRLCLAHLLRNYPDSLTNPMVSYRKLLDEHKREHRSWLYEGDLEADFLHLLGQIQSAARQKPLGIEIDFRA